MRTVTQEHDAPSRAGDVFTIIAVMTALATLAVFMRLFIKMRMAGSKLLWDDHLIMISLGLSFIHGGICLAQIRYGSGYHLSDLKEEVRNDMWKSARDNVPSIIWSEAEFNGGIVCACLPYMKPLFMRILGVRSVSGSNRSHRATSMAITASRGTTTIRNNGHTADARAPDDGTALYEVKVLRSQVRQVDDDGLLVGSREQLVDVVKTTKVVVSSS